MEHAKYLKIGFGGGCHWCTEAVFQSIKGVGEVEQGYLSTKAAPDVFYEGVIITYHPELIDLKSLIKIHLRTHRSTSNHRMRDKYLSAVYIFDQQQIPEVKNIIECLQSDFQEKIITIVTGFGKFKRSRPQIRNYYKTDPQRPFCKVYIQPKLKILRDDFPESFESPIL